MGLTISMRNFDDFDSDCFTHPLPRTVLTSSKYGTDLSKYGTDLLLRTVLTSSKYGADSSKYGTDDPTMLFDF
jgi:hypothetical protein